MTMRTLARLVRARRAVLGAPRGFARKAKVADGSASAAAPSADAGAARSAPGADDPAAASRSSPSPSEAGTAGAAADEAVRAARKAAEDLSGWAKAAGAGASRARAAAGAKVPKSATSLLGKIADAFKEEYRLARMDPGDAAEERRKQRPGYVAPGPVDEYTGTTAVATRKEKKSAFRAALDQMAERAGLARFSAKLAQLKTTGAYKKGEEALEDLRERWETSDSPIVHRIQDMQEGMWTESEQAEAYGLIRRRLPDFDLVDLMAEVRRDVPKILGAYLRQDVEALEKLNISPEMLERFQGTIRAIQAEKRFHDPRILHLSELELSEVRMLDGDPLVCLNFSCQIVNCVRNQKGEVVEGSEDDIQAVHYLWAMQLTPKEFVAEDGRKYQAQTWLLREQIMRGVMAIVG